jgi:phospholipid/cholesterol/gamma-HCH transport system substrate-binding protein
MDKSKLELKVGVFVFVAIVILSVFIFRIGNLRNYGAGYPIRFVFANISGVKFGSPVRLAGVEIGEVRRVNILEDKQNRRTQIEVIAWIGRTLLIPQGSEAFVSTLGLLGEKYIGIIPPPEYEDFLKPGDTLIGNDPIAAQYWIDEADKIIKDLQEIIRKVKAGEGTIGKLLYEDRLYQELGALISDIRQAREGTIGKLLYDDKLYQELEALISDIRRHPWKLFWKTREKKKK